MKKDLKLTKNAKPFVWNKKAIDAAKKVGEIIKRNEADEFRSFVLNKRYIKTT